MVLHFHGAGSLVRLSSLSLYFITAELHLYLPPTALLPRDFPHYIPIRENPIGPGQFFSFSHMIGYWMANGLTAFWWPVPSNQWLCGIRGYKLSGRGLWVQQFSARGVGVLDVLHDIHQSLSSVKVPEYQKSWGSLSCLIVNSWSWGYISGGETQGSSRPKELF